MPDWLQESFKSDTDVSLQTLAIRLAAALGFGVVVSLLYRAARRPAPAHAAAFMTTLLMLTVLIAVVTVVIGNSVARAFGLVGALSIVRFRTIVEDTRDTAFVILAVAVGMAVGAGFLIVPLAALPAAAMAAFWFGLRRGSISPPMRLVVRVAVGRSPDEVLKEAFSTHLEEAFLVSTVTARQGVALELTYRARLRRPDGAVALVAHLNGVDGIQGVELGPLD